MEVVRLLGGAADDSENLGAARAGKVVILEDQGGRAFATAMATTGGGATQPRASTLEKLGRESVRLAGQVAGLMERSYQKAVLRVQTTTVGVG